MKQILLIAVVLILLPSCMVTKCRYGNGIKIEMPSLRRNSDEVKKAKAPGRTARFSISAKADTTKATSSILKKDTVELASTPVQENPGSEILSPKKASVKNTRKKISIPKLETVRKISVSRKDNLAKAVHSGKHSQNYTGFFSDLEVLLTILIVLAGIAFFGGLAYAIVCLFIPSLFEVGATILLAILVLFLQGL